MRTAALAYVRGASTPSLREDTSGEVLRRAAETHGARDAI